MLQILSKCQPEYIFCWASPPAEAVGLGGEQCSEVSCAVSWPGEELGHHTGAFLAPSHSFPRLLPREKTAPLQQGPASAASGHPHKSCWRLHIIPCLFIPIDFNKLFYRGIGFSRERCSANTGVITQYHRRTPFSLKSFIHKQIIKMEANIWWHDRVLKYLRKKSNVS